MSQEFPDSEQNEQSPSGAGGITSSSTEMAQEQLEEFNVLAEQIRGDILNIKDQETRENLSGALDTIIEQSKTINTSAPSADENIADRARNILNILKNFAGQVQEAIA